MARKYRVKIVHVFYQDVEADTREEAQAKGYEQHMESEGSDFAYAESSITR